MCLPCESGYLRRHSEFYYGSSEYNRYWVFPYIRFKPYKKKWLFSNFQTMNIFQTTALVERIFSSIRAFKAATSCKTKLAKNYNRNQFVMSDINVKKFALIWWLECKQTGIISTGLLPKNHGGIGSTIKLMWENPVNKKRRRYEARILALG
ncbi:hypothetical protein PV325_011908, partial [Microctonus aethiopoides]